MMDFAAANAAATTRLSVGNEQVFKNFTLEKRLVFFYFGQRLGDPNWNRFWGGGVYINRE